MNKNQARLKYACYTISLSMSIVANLPPVLFLTFRNLYNISYTLLGLLVLANYLTQLGVDLVFSFFSHRFNIPKVVKSMPYMTLIGLLLYSVYPLCFPQTAYVGLIFGTVIFSASAGLAEVLISPIIATIPSEDPDREMSKLHSVYAWGVIPVIIMTTLYLLAFGSKNWHWLVFIFMLVPVLSMILFSKVSVPALKPGEKTTGAMSFLKNKTVWLYVAAIFFGGAAECTMAQWSSSYLEMALNIPKVWGDVFGVALFAFMLGIGRTMYAKYGKNLINVLLMCSVGATLCYFVASVTSQPIAGLVSCALTGLFTSMLWPGTLVIASERFPESGVMIYALMAAGGDCGASVTPQLIGIITDVAIENARMISLAHSIGLSPEQFGMKLGLIVAMLFPLSAIFIFLHIKRKNR